MRVAEVIHIGIIFGFLPHYALSLVTLSIDTVGPHSNVTCPLTNLTCTAVNIPGSDLRWFVGEERLTHTFEPSDAYPLQLPVPSDLTGVMMVQITDASVNETRGTVNFMSIMSVNVSALMIAGVVEISCGSLSLFSRSNHVTLRKTTPPPPPANCSLLPSPGGANISFQWSPSFTSQYAVERYRVSVNPDPSSCFSDQVSPSEDYSCSGLVLGTHYTFIVSAINCGDQEGERSTITAVLQLPQSPASPAVVPVCTGSLSELTEIRVEWNALETGQSGTCVDIEYIVYLVRGSLLNQTSLNSSDCSSDGICSISYSRNTYFQNEDPATIIISACNAIVCRNTSLSGDIIAEPRLTTTNWILLIVSVFVELIILLMYFCMIIGLTIRARKRLKDQNYLSVSMARCALMMLLSLLSLMLWIVSIALCVTIGVYVGTQDNTCDLNWQSTRDNLIISTLVLTLLSLLLVLMVIPVALVSREKKIERSFGKIKPERENFRDVEACPFCYKKFGDFVKTSNKICDGCGKVVCEDCRTQEVYLPYMERSSKVCKQCYTIYVEEQAESPAPSMVGFCCWKNDIHETGQVVELTEVSS